MSVCVGLLSRSPNKFRASESVPPFIWTAYNFKYLNGSKLITYEENQALVAWHMQRIKTFRFRKNR